MLFRSDDGVVPFISAHSIPTQTDDAFEQTETQQLDEFLEFGPVNVILNQSVFGECKVIVFFEAGMFFRNDTIRTKTSKRDRSDGKFFSVGKFDAFRFLIGDGIFLVVRLVCAFSDIYQIAVPILARFYVSEYLTFMFSR